MEVNFGAFIDNLYYMGVGMACIFIVIGVIILSITALDKITAAIAAKKAVQEAESTEQNQ